MFAAYTALERYEEGNEPVALLKADDQAHVRHHFEALTNSVKIVFFADLSEDGDCQYCETTLDLVSEVASLSPKISVEAHDLFREPEVAKLYGVDRAPAIAIVQVSGDGQSTTDFGIRFYGIPSGYEFMTLLEDIVLVSTGEAELSPKAVAKLAALQRPIHLQVFVTPTCPYCPQMVSLAHKLAVASPLVRADGVEATEFPELSERYGVYGVPRTVISVEGGIEQHIEGAVPEAQLLDALQKAAGSGLVTAHR
jgi:glutaredoxin-like protein